VVVVDLEAAETAVTRIRTVHADLESGQRDVSRFQVEGRPTPPEAPAVPHHVVGGITNQKCDSGRQLCSLVDLEDRVGCHARNLRAAQLDLATRNVDALVTVAYRDVQHEGRNPMLLGALRFAHTGQSSSPRGSQRVPVPWSRHAQPCSASIRGRPRQRIPEFVSDSRLRSGVRASLAYGVMPAAAARCARSSLRSNRVLPRFVM